MKCSFYSFHIWRQEKIGYIRPHTHPYTELVFYEYGSGSTKIGGTEYQYEPNTFSVTLPETPMDERHKTLTNPWCVLMDITPDMNYLYNGVFTDTEDGIIFKLLKQIKDEQSMKLYHYKESLNSLTELLTIHIERIQNIDSDKKNLFKDVINYIEDHYYEDIDIARLANITNYSYDHFRHLFKEVYGISPKNYIINRRLDQAKVLLQQSNHTITYIAQLCGFSNNNHFSKLFRKYTGLTPKDYRSYHL